MKYKLLRFSLLGIFAMLWGSVFAEEVTPVVFENFEITNDQLSNGFDASTLPACVTFSGTKRGDSHGYGNVTLTVVVDRPVKFTIGGCQYANPANCKITNAAGEVLATPNLKTDKCYHQTEYGIETRTVIYEYTGEPTTLTFSDIAYLPYFKAEAFEPQPEPVAFEDFEITNEQLSGEFDASTLPAGVTFSGTKRGDSHGYGNVTITVPVTGKVTFTIGGCQYANPATCKVTNAAGELLAEPNLKTEKCYHQDGSAVTYIYKGEPTTLTFSNIAYLPYFKAEGEKVHELITLDNEPATVTFPFNEGTEGQKAELSNAGYFLNSKVTHGDGLFIKDKNNGSGFDMTRFEPYDQNNSADESNAIRFLFQPKPGFVFTPTKVALKTTRFGTDNGLLDIAWQNADGTTATLATEVKPNRNDGTKPAIAAEEGQKFSDLSYDVTNATPGEGVCGLLVNLYHLQGSKQIGFADIVIEGTLSGTEKEVPILASFKVNGTEYAAEDVFGDLFEATLELKNGETMVSAENPLTDVTAASGTVGTLTYEGTETTCTVTIPMSAAETQIDYVLNVVYKPYFTLSYLDVEGNVLATQQVEKDAAIGEFGCDIATVPATKEGYKARGWFKKGVLGEKFTTADVVTGNTTLYSVQTEIEEVSTYKKYAFNLTDKFFYAEDHEAFNPSGDNFYWHDNQHGWAFRGNNKIDLLVGPKSIVSVTLCRYGSANDIVVTDASGNTLGTLPGYNTENVDGEVVAFNYEGEGGTITLNLSTSGEMYVHAVNIVNTAEVNFESQGNWYFVKAGDAGSFIEVLGVVNGINAAKDAERSFIFLPDGTYDLDAAVGTIISGHNISIIGQSTEGTIITTKPDVSIEGLGSADMLHNSGTNLYLQDLTLKNALDYYKAGSAGRAAVLQDTGTRTIGKNVRMLSYQDTYYSSNSSQQAYWETCDIHGTVDFICGGGDIRFQNTTISLEPRATNGTGGRTITAPTTTTQFGYVFDGCTVVDLANGKGDWNFGRTWQNQPICVYLNTTLDNNAKNTLVSSRWTQKGMNNKDPKLFGEYGTKDINGNDITPASNTITSFGGTFETILTADQAAGFAYDKMFTDWDPMTLATQVQAPSDAKYENGTVTWSPTYNNASAYALFKNGEFVGLTEGFSFDIQVGDSDILTLRAANPCGGLGEPVTVTVVTGIDELTTDAVPADNAVYNMQGVRVQKAQKGLYIINGQKVVIK